MILYVMTDRTKLKLPLFVGDSMEELVKYSGKSERYIRKSMDVAKAEGRESIYMMINVEETEGENDGEND